MSKTRAQLLTTSEGQVVGKSQLYALLVDKEGNAILDVFNNEQLIAIQADIGGGIKLATSNAAGIEISSSQDSQITETEKTYVTAVGASQIEVYVESGAVRVRTDGQPCTVTTGEPLTAGFAAAWEVDSISVFYVTDSIVTVVSR